jgi:hypothetical protein
MLVLSGGVTLLVLARLPENYFVSGRRAFRPRTVRGWLLKIAKNLGGVVLVALGLVLSVPGVPGQGILTILLGIMLLDFPGKYRLERRIIRIRRVHTFINRVRRRLGRQPLEIPAEV